MASLGALRAQTTSFCIAPSCPQTIQLPLSVDTLYAQITASDGAKGVLWTQVSGPSTAVMGALISTPNGTGILVSALPVSKLVAGVYVFKATGSSVSGSLMTANAQVTVQAATPPSAPPRTVVSVTWKLVNGVWVASFVYSDGTIQ